MASCLLGLGPHDRDEDGGVAEVAGDLDAEHGDRAGRGGRRPRTGSPRRRPRGSPRPCAGCGERAWSRQTSVMAWLKSSARGWAATASATRVERLAASRAGPRRRRRPPGRPAPGSPSCSALGDRDVEVPVELVHDRLQSAAACPGGCGSWLTRRSRRSVATVMADPSSVRRSRPVDAGAATTRARGRDPSATDGGPPTAESAGRADQSVRRITSIRYASITSSVFRSSKLVILMPHSKPSRTSLTSSLNRLRASIAPL